MFQQKAPKIAIGRLAGLIAAIVGHCCVGLEAQQQAAEGVERPKYNALRYKEDWSVLGRAAPGQASDFFDPIKYVPLTEDGSIWVSFGGQVRLRFENWNNFGFSDQGASDDTYLLTRLLFHGDLHVGEHLRVFVEGKSALSTDDDPPVGRRTLDVDELDLQNGFVDLKLPLFDSDHSFTFRAGRQELLFGKQRLVSPLDWANVRRTFDGFSGIFDLKPWTITGFWTREVPVQKYDFNDSDSNTDFYGLYAAGKVPGAILDLDLYWLGLEDDDGRFNGTVGKETRHTFGGRIGGKLGDSGFDADLEGAYQFGELGRGDVDAFMTGLEVGYTFAHCPASPRLHLGLDYATGDHAPGGDVQTFHQLYPLGHAYLGWIDAVGRQNIIDLTPGLTVRPIDKMTVMLVGHLFWLADKDDALYNAGGGARTRVEGSSREVGSEIDLTVSYQFDRHLLGTVGYSHFFTGDYIGHSGSGAEADIDFFYLILQYTF